MNYFVTIPNNLWHSHGVQIVAHLSDVVGRPNYKITFEKNEENQVIEGKPILIEFSSFHYVTLFNLIFGGIK